MKLTSTAFENGGQIPSRYTCDGEDISPPLEIAEMPAGTESLALVMDDPDAPRGTFDHWIVWNIAPETKKIPEGKQPSGVAGKNDFGKLAYGGPCPPSGTHTYRFRLYALEIVLNLEEGADKERLQQAMKGYILGEALLEGDYARK